MACKQMMLQVSTQQATEGELSVSIMDQIRANHGHADDNFDVESLLVAVKNILNGASLVDNALGTTHAQLKEKAREASFSPPLYTIKQLSIEVDIEVVKTKNVFLLFSGLDISDDDISILKPIYDEISTKDVYKIVWIPIVERWTKDMQKRFEMLRSKMPPWYIVQNFSFKLGINYIKDEWQFRDRPIVVMMNSQGIVEHKNALHMMTIWGTKAFPFTIEREHELSNGEDWFGYWMFEISPEVSTWIKRGRYILFYGSMDEELKQQLTNKAKALAKDPVIELFCMEKGSKGCDDDRNILCDFWKRIESFLSFRTHHKETESNTVTQEVQKLLSYKTKSEWAVLCKGSKFVKVLEKFEKPQQQTQVPNGEDWFGNLMIHIIPKEKEEELSWITQGKYIIFYGGNDEKWRKDFCEQPNFQNSKLVKRNANISVNLFCIGKSSKGQKDERNILSNFWNRIDSIRHKKIESEVVREEVQKLFSYQKKGGWAVLCKGSKLVCSGQKRTIQEALDKLCKKYQRVHEIDFENRFKECYYEILRNGEDWFGYLMIDIFHQKEEVLTSIKQGNYIFFHCGDDQELENKIKAATFAKFPDMQNPKNYIYRVPKEKIENQKACFRVALHELKLTISKESAEENNKLIQCLSEGTGWVVLCKGYRFKDCYKSEEL